MASKNIITNHEKHLQNSISNHESPVILNYSYIFGNAYGRLEEIRKPIDHYKIFTNLH